MKQVSIHDAYGGFGDKNEQSNNQLNPNSTSNKIIPQVQSQAQTQSLQNTNAQDQKNLPSDASYSAYPVMIKCPKCHKEGVTRIQFELGTASWVWCVLMAPFALSGFICLCLDSCKDKVHYCTRCGEVVGKKFAKVC